MSLYDSWMTISNCLPTSMPDSEFHCQSVVITAAVIVGAAAAAALIIIIIIILVVVTVFQIQPTLWVHHLRICCPDGYIHTQKNYKMVLLFTSFPILTIVVFTLWLKWGACVTYHALSFPVLVLANSKTSSGIMQLHWKTVHFCQFS